MRTRSQPLSPSGLVSLDTAPKAKPAALRKKAARKSAAASSRGHGHGGEAAAQLGSSVVARVRKAGYAGSVAGVLSTVPDEEVRRLKSAAASRRRAARLLREAVVARGEVEVRALR
ncbi:hypothetical protein KEM52_006212 [Ascosphaera acerosa]|nr:hypothetical protein KEM52_006212 [Ascosphaera acerosa]